MRESLEDREVNDEFYSDTRFVSASRQCLKALEMFDIKLVRDMDLNPTSHVIEWTQIKRSLFGCRETYLLVDYYQDGNKDRKFKVYINEGTEIPASFRTSGYNGMLHFGMLCFSVTVTNEELDGVIFFVIHPNSWGPFQHRFKTNAFTGFVKKGISKAAGAATGAATVAALGSVVPGLGNIVGGILGLTAGVIASRVTPNYFGNYLRFIG